MNAAPKLDQFAVDVLTTDLLLVIRRHLLVRPAKGTRVYEVLSALASVTALMLSACRRNNAELRSFVDLELMQAIDEHPPDAPRDDDQLDIPPFLRRATPVLVRQQ